MQIPHETRQPRCGLCGSLNVVQICADMPQSMRSDGLILHESLKKFHCDECGAVSGRNDNQPHIPYLRSNGASIFDLRRHHSVAGGISKLIEKYEFSDSPKVLEVGAASFETSFRLKERNPKARITAIDNSPERVISSAAIDMIIGDFSNHNFHVPFDVIFSNNVVEHIADTRQFLGRCSKFLEDAGVLIICCPTFSPASNELLFADHLYHFTPSGLSICCESSDLQIVDHHVSGWDSLTHVYVLRKTLNRMNSCLTKANHRQLFNDRQSHLLEWAKQDETVLGKLRDNVPTLLYGAGEFSQLVRAYLPRTYTRIAAITVDDLTGSREFDKPKIELKSTDPHCGQIIIGSHPASRLAVKEKLLKFGFSDDQIISLSV
jgi:SAM-dependent methyltransferase